MLRYALPLLSLLLAAPAHSYPIDGYDYSGIRRLRLQQLVQAGELPGNKLPPGALKSIDQVGLNLSTAAAAERSIPATSDPIMQAKLDAVFAGRPTSYAIALMEITPGQPFRYAQRQAHRAFVPGSVGKLAVAAGLFNELARRFPDDIEKRRELLKSRMVRGGKWIHSDHHTVPHFDPQSGKHFNRIPQEEDVFSLYEWTDHMLSPSANAAASVVWKEVILMRAFAEHYPPSADQEKKFWSETPKRELSPMVMSTVNDPLLALGIKEQDWRLGNLFTATAKTIAPGFGGSKATPYGLMQWLLALEQGKVVDDWSSTEIKRLMYSTARRIRYAAAPALAKDAVYFKSGSQYKCKPEADFACAKYKGNVDNYMNSVAIVEQPDQRVYLVVLMSNVLRVDSAVEHQAIAAEIKQLIASTASAGEGAN